jgi:predicted PurR-regulated permease PerM
MRGAGTTADFGRSIHGQLPSNVRVAGRRPLAAAWDGSAHARFPPLARCARMNESQKRREIALTLPWATLGRTVLCVLAALALWYVGDVLLVIFAGVLFAVILRAAAEWLERKTPIGPRASYALVMLTAAALIAGTGWGLGPRVVNQAGQIIQIIPQSVERIRQHIAGQAWGGYAISLGSRILYSSKMVSRVSTWISSLADQFTLLLIGVVLGLFFGANPPLYMDGGLKLFPARRRQRARKVFSEIAYTLRWWIIGQLIPMSVLGVGAFIGLSILGVPLAFTLALFTAVMLFIPYIGSLISLVPAALVGLMVGPMTMVWVIVVYLGVHALEGYAITPLAQKRAIRLPPVITISAQLLMWTIAGLLGLVVATPLAAAVVVTVQMLYLHEEPKHTHGDAA